MNLYRPVKIGNVELSGNLFLAPVAGYSDAAFRSVCVENGAAFTYTEMVSSEALVRNNLKTENLMRRAYNEKFYAVQIFGGQEEVMAQAAKIAAQKSGCDVIDINCGCPVPKITKNGAGSALTRDPEKLYKIVKAVVEVLKNEFEKEIPVTVKIRSGWEQKIITWKEAALAAIQAGAKAVAIHPRTKAQGYDGRADWSIIKDLVALANGSENSRNSNEKIAIFGSGDLFKPEDAKKMLEQTGADGVMFARGAMGNPFIFKDAISLLTTGNFEPVSAEERIKTGFRELERLVCETSEKSACREMRKRFSAYSKGIQNGAELRAKIVRAETVQNYKDIFKMFV